MVLIKNIPLKWKNVLQENQERKKAFLKKLYELFRW